MSCLLPVGCVQVHQMAWSADEMPAGIRLGVPWLRVADVREELLATLTALADFAYGWGLLDAHVPRLQAAVSIFSPDHWSKCQDGAWSDGSQ